MGKDRLLSMQILFANFSAFGLANLYYLLPVYLFTIGIISPQISGWIVSSFYAASTCFRPFIGSIVRKIGFKKLWIMSALLCFVSSLCFALAEDNLFLLISLRITLGLGFSAYMVSLTIYQTLAISDEVRGSYFSIISAGSIAPLFILVPFADFLLNSGYPNFYIWLSPIVALICLFMAIVLTPVEIPSSTNSIGVITDLLHLKGARILLGSILFFTMADASLVMLSALANERNLLVSCFLTANAVTAVIARIFFSNLLDRFPRELIAGPSIMIIAIALILASSVTNNILFIIVGILFGVGMGFGFPIHLCLVGDVAPAHLRPDLTSFLWFCTGLAFFLIPLMIGQIAELTGFSNTFRLLGCFVFMGAIFLHFYYWRPLFLQKNRAY